MKSVLDYIEENENQIETNDLDNLIESDNFNDLDDESKSDIFYMKSFYMSTKNYIKLEEAVEDFEVVIKCINDNNYLQNSHECFEILIINFLNSIDDLLKPYCKNNQEVFINYIHKFLQSLEDLHYPNKNCKDDIIKELINIHDTLISLKKRINEQNLEKFKRYSSDLETYIKQEQDNNNNINIDNNNDDNIKSNENSYDDLSFKNKNEFFNNKYFKNDMNNNISINNDDNYKKQIKTDNINIIKYNINLNENNFSENNYLDEPLKNEIINVNNDFVKNSLNSLNNLKKSIRLDDNVPNFEIINNEGRIYDSNNSLNDSRKYYESMNQNYSLYSQVKDLIESKNKKEEEEIVKVIDEEINNFVEEIYPMFTSKSFNKNEEDKFSYLKKRYLKSEIDIENNFGNNNNISLNINNNINLINQNNPHKKKKKGKKKKKNKSVSEK